VHLLLFFNKSINALNIITVYIKTALRYTSEGRGFDSRWCHWNFSLA